ncbi:hypothetical protein EOM09_08750, partial [bacterium]|nr:hypothetical protein [bacterium]
MEEQKLNSIVNSTKPKPNIKIKICGVGGGGGNNDRQGAMGASGIVIVKYEVPYIEISTCQTLDANTKYKLIANISAAPNDCFIFGGNNIFFMCENTNIGGQNTGEAFTTNDIGRENLSIINCEIDAFSESFRFRNSKNIILENISITNPRNYALRCDLIDGCENLSMKNIIVDNVQIDDGFYVLNSNNLSFENITLKNIGTGNGDHAYYISNTKNVFMKNIFLENIYDTAIYVLDNSNNYTFENIYINTTTRTSANGIDIRTNSNKHIFENITI